MPAQCHKRSPRQITSIGSHCGRTLWAIPLRAHGILQAGRSRPRYEPGATGIGKLENGSMPEAISESAAQKVFARAGSRKPRSDQHQECSTTDNHGYRRLACKRNIEMTPLCKIEATLPRVLGSREVRLGGVVDE